MSAAVPHKAARCTLAALLSACAWVAHAQTGGEPVFTAPPGSGVRSEAEAAARPDPQELAHDAVALFRRVCVRVAGEPALAVDRALAAGLTPHVSEDSRDSRALLGGAPGQVYAPPGPAALLQVALADEGRCTVWAEQAEGPQVKEGFETVIDNLRSRGAKVRAVGERVVERGGSWRHQSSFEVQDERGVVMLDAVTLLSERPGTQVLSTAPGGPKGSTETPP